VEFVVDDLTRLSRVSGPFDLLVDYGAFDDLSMRQRAAYVRSVVPLTRPGSKFLLWCFEWEPRRWERIVAAALPFGAMMLRPGEAWHRFGQTFEVERVAGEADLPSWPRGWAAYLMTRR
jgi:hypothetical protein